MPIARQFDGLCANDGWWSEISAQKAELEEQHDRFIRFVTSDRIEGANGIDLTGLESAYTAFMALLTTWLQNRPASYDLNMLKEALQHIDQPFRDLRDLIEGKTFKEESGSRDFRHYSGSFYSPLRELERILKSRKAQAYEVGAALLPRRSGNWEITPSMRSGASEGG
ncbi:MAG: hypothetical protein U5P41_05405 [Gammaproteobacteria bacterium]|nr:hypothetical protein [Gammaproteobacteria bacterium]